MVELQAWGPGDLPLLQRLLGDPAMMEHLGGPESQEKIADRQRRYEADPGCLKIVADGEELGWVGYWDARVARRQRLRDRLGGASGGAGPRRRHGGDAARHRDVAGDQPPPLAARVPGRRQPALERDLPEARLHAARGARLRVPAGHGHAL